MSKSGWIAQTMSFLATFGSLTPLIQPGRKYGTRHVLLYNGFINLIPGPILGNQANFSLDNPSKIARGKLKKDSVVT